MGFDISISQLSHQPLLDLYMGLLWIFSSYVYRYQWGKHCIFKWFHWLITALSGPILRCLRESYPAPIGSSGRKSLLLVVSTTPLKNDGVRQLGFWHSQLNGSKHVPNHQPVFCWWRLKQQRSNFIQFSQAAFMINESILGKCFRSSPSLTNPGNSPLTVKYDCPQLSLSIITSALETNKTELGSYLIIPCSPSPGLFVDPHLLVVPAPLQAVRRPRGVRRPWSTAMAQIWGCIIYCTGWWF